MINGIGRPNILQRKGLSLEDLERIYDEEGSYRKVAVRLGTTKRTIQKYLTRHGGRPRGKRPKQYHSKTRALIEEHPDILKTNEKEVVALARERGLSPSYARALLYEKKREVRTRIIELVRGLLRENVAIRDTKGRYIPVAAIRYVWIPRWRWNRPIYVRVVLKDGTRAKLPTSIEPDVDLLSGPADSVDPQPGT